ncbi:hypothetical protein MIND_00585000 [Mycena indigotica]|uniref:Uncharacterized protein n=1 Tax=Mycena indigotica TaxID=2126181 RepID=A0A8H6W3F5_9AGAR|nr:uncharacterized protein MIND_00585000 [Mycena indigotica]KAF7303557.1 hypothetical protein MIND_00585000 [Mycena indigotica]
MSEPTLPPELERAVFALAAWRDQRMICTLALVARRVNVWIGPLRYRMCRIRSRTDLEALWQRVEALPASGATQRASRRLCGCRMPYPASRGHSLGGPLTNLRRLSMNANDVFPEAGADVPSFVLDFPPLTGLTHLELLGDPGPWMPRVIAAAYPALTHLSLFNRYFPDVMREALQALPRLTMCVYVHVEYLAREDQAAPSTIYAQRQAAIIGLDDPRAVAVMPVYSDENWGPGAWRGRDYWARAEEELALRRVNRSRVTPRVE